MDASTVSHRRVVGIAGAPGSGKSALAAALAADDPERVVVVPMDGFHLAQRELGRLARADRKGAPDTFDVAGFVAVLRRIRAAVETVYAPAFERSIEEPIAGAIAIAPSHTVVVEGLYLLHDGDGWEHVGPLLDECWWLDVDDALRRARLTARHVAHGRTAAEAADWVARVDDPNAALVAPSAARATCRIAVGDRSPVELAARYRLTP